MRVSGIITLTTDFGLADPYVSVLKGVILSINPAARLMDITHQIEPGSIVHAAAILKEAHNHFPRGTVHLCVVDPGVGGKRRPILFETEHFLFVGPDNGIFWPVINEYQMFTAVHLTKSEYFREEISSTFHGRDIFAPVAAYLSRGADPLSMGELISDPLALTLPLPSINKDVLRGQVVRIDRFGNIITNIHMEDLKKFLRENDIPVTKIKGLKITGLRNAYSEVDEGELLVLLGSGGYLEISENKGRACDKLLLNRKDAIGLEVEVFK